MPIRVNRVARGLLSFFDSKSAQQPPQFVSDEIRCVMDLGRLQAWGAADDLSSQLTALASAEGFYGLTDSNLGIVPADETWMIMRASIISRTTVAAGDTFAGAIAFRTLGNPLSSGIQAQDHMLQINQSFTNGQLACFYMAASEPVILKPGDQLGFLNLGSTFAAAAPAADFNVRVFKLRV